MRTASDDLENRRPVWEALSDLYLDTDTSLSRPWRAQVLAASPYTIGELETILAREVHPICARNLWAIAGEWAGFDMAWIEQEILKRGRARFRWFTGFHLFNPGSAEWRQTRTAVLAMRDAGTLGDR